jgi:uncharacterized membrane protein YdjX (TVP38/TMEM64 family)
MNIPQSHQVRNSRIWWLIAALAVSGLCLYLAWRHWEDLWRWLSPYYQIFTDKELLEAKKEKLRASLGRLGYWGHLLFIIIQALQVVLAPIPGEATGFFGGYFFGTPLGLLYSTIGLTLGSMAAFLLGHWLEKRYIAKIISPETLQRFDFLMERQGVLVAFILFLIPGFPKDALCFILGLSPMNFRVFLVICIIGRFPGTLMLTLQGAQVYKGNYWNTLILTAVCLLLAGAAYFFRETLYEWIKRLEEYRRNGRKSSSEEK